eukprot:scaffold1397_cov135-Skeletonema_menzelii.AAC.3
MDFSVSPNLGLMSNRRDHVHRVSAGSCGDRRFGDKLDTKASASAINYIIMHGSDGIALVVNNSKFHSSIGWLEETFLM